MAETFDLYMKTRLLNLALGRSPPKRQISGRIGTELSHDIETTDFQNLLLRIASSSSPTIRSMNALEHWFDMICLF